MAHVPTMSEIPNHPCNSLRQNKKAEGLLHKIKCHLKNENFLLNFSFSSDSFFPQQKPQEIAQNVRI